MWALSILAFRLNIIVYAGMSLDICLNDINKKQRLNKPYNASKSSHFALDTNAFEVTLYTLLLS